MVFRALGPLPLLLYYKCNACCCFTSILASSSIRAGTSTNTGTGTGINLTLRLRQMVLTSSGGTWSAVPSETYTQMAWDSRVLFVRASKKEPENLESSQLQICIAMRKPWLLQVSGLFSLQMLSLLGSRYVWICVSASRRDRRRDRRPD